MEDKCMVEKKEKENKIYFILNIVVFVISFE
jgi:hypothetical protein